MKHKLKKILLLFVFTGTLFVSCTTEEEVVRNENYKSKFQVREQSYQELIKVNTFKRALDKIPKQKTTTTLNGKTVMEEQYGFSIIDTPIKITETDETIAYNLLVKSDTITEGNYFENLLINIDKQTNLIKAYLVKYNLEDTNLVYTNHNSFLFNGTRSAREIMYNNNLVRTFGKETSGPCITYQILMCSYQGNHVAGEQCILNNFDLLYVQTQTSGDCSSGVDPIDTSGGIGGTTSSGGTTSNGNTNDGSTTVIDNPTPLCDTCIELTPELSDFLADLSTEQLATWNALDYVVKRSIVSYLVQNSYSVESILFAINAIQDLNNDECGILPTIFEPSNITAPYNPNLLGDYPAPLIQHDHDAIQQQFNIIRSTQGDLAAVNYLINIYNMNTFGTRASITFNYSVSVANGLPNGDHGRAIIGYNSLGNLYSCELKIDINLLSFNDFGYITRVIKHELLHVLQAQIYGQHNLHESTREFDAYFNQIFTFHDLKQIQDLSISCGLAKYMITYMNQMPEVNKNERLDMIKRVNDTFPKVCPEW